ncbi:putative transposase for insertion sequence element [Methanocella paludicola SANAE]|uniref:Transposase for insertion sequence element n=1 Tax=Methanocella paludicola (strain DSM 17711 / JCM 13418 / NBRC 101707 / SANAE) TaxID=304371 RepID=D1YX13_METPS|nr:IS256 family transposase [Methanocella paludicola]BAI60985.1 putative transposase for insertion sequence element [Methanocella paludicola SANAE]
MRNTRPYSDTKYALKYIRADSDAMKNLIRDLLNSILEEEACEQAGAMHYERAEGRRARRNGYKSRGLVTRYGKVELEKPQLREVPFETCLFDRYSRAEKAVVNVISESYLQGVSTRKMRKVLQTLGVEVSKSSVSRISEELDDDVRHFLARPLGGTPYLFVDATYIKVRDNGMYVSKPVFIAMGVNQDGYKEILDSRIMDREDEDWWTVFFDDLKKRGLTGIKMVISDGHKGIKKAVEQCFLGASWQLCHVHFRRSVIKTVPAKQRGEINQLLKDHIESPNLLANLAEDLEARGLDKASSLIDKNLPCLYNYLAFPPHQWIKLRTTNTLENVNSLIKRRTRPIGAFPSNQSALRVIVNILMDVNEEYAVDKKHIDLERND